MSWRIFYTKKAKQDLREIYEYIAYELLVPETASEQTRRIMKEIKTLDEMPRRYPLYEEKPWYSEGIRLFPVGNYLVFYQPIESQNTVSIVRIMYGGRDIKKHLDRTAID